MSTAAADIAPASVAVAPATAATAASAVSASSDASVSVGSVSVAVHSGIVYGPRVSVSTATAQRYAAGAWDMATVAAHRRALSSAVASAASASAASGGTAASSTNAVAAAAAAGVPLSPRLGAAAGLPISVPHSSQPSHNRRIRGVIFDLGGTLCGSVDVTGKDADAVKRSKAEQTDLKCRALAAAVDATWKLAPAVFLPAWQASCAAWKSVKDEVDTNTPGTLERTAEQQLRACLQSLGLPASSITDTQLAACLEKFYEPELQLRHVFPGVAQMLHELRHVRGLRLALVTNSADTVKQKKTIALFDLDRWFNGLVISAEVGYRKPDSRIFQLVLDECWKGELERGEVVCVGDMLNRDVLGAHRMGMKCILLDMPAFAKHSVNHKFAAEIVPDATIDDIRQVPHAIDQLNTDFLLHPPAWHAFRPFTVGYLFNGKKASKFIAEKVFAFPDREDVRYVAVDIDRPLSAQGPFDVLLLKFTDVQVRALFDRDASAQQQLDAVQRWIAAHPTMCVTEPFERVHTLLDRERVHTLVRTSQLASKSGLALKAPATVVIRLSPEQSAADRAAELSKLRTLRFPLICKALKACGSNDAHSMAIVRHADAVPQISFLRSALAGASAGAWLFQELLEHGSRLYKVYVLGGTTTITVKPSLPPITPLASYTPPAPAHDGKTPPALTLDTAPVLYFSSQVLTDLSPYPPACVASPYYGERHSLNGRMSLSAAAAAAAARTSLSAAAAAMNADGAADFKLSPATSPTHGASVAVAVADPAAAATTDAAAAEDPAAVAAATARMVAAKEKYKSSQSVVSAEIKASSAYQQLAAAVDDLSAQLRARLGLDLIGYDVIVHAGQHYIVDLNYLPSYNVVPQLRELMLTFLQTKAAKHKRAVEEAAAAQSAPSTSSVSLDSKQQPAAVTVAPATASPATASASASTSAGSSTTASRVGGGSSSASSSSGPSASESEWVTIAGYGSLLSLKSARRTCPNLRRFRLGAVYGYTRVFNLVSVSLLASGHAQWSTREVGGLSAVPVLDPHHTGPRPVYADAPDEHDHHHHHKHGHGHGHGHAHATPAPAYSSAIDLIRNGSSHVTPHLRATTRPLVVSLFDIPRAELAPFLLREHRYRFVEVDAHELRAGDASASAGAVAPTTPLDTAAGAVTLSELITASAAAAAAASSTSAAAPAGSVTPAILCVASNDRLYRATRFPSRQAYRDMVGRFYGGALWRRDLKPVREYLRLCLQGAYDLGSECYDNFLRTSFLGDERTDLHQYIAAQPDLWPVQLRPAGVGPFGLPALMKPMPVAHGVSLALATSSTTSSTSTAAGPAAADAKSATK